MQQRLRDLALNFGDLDSYLMYQQEQSYWGKKPKTLHKTLVQRTIIIDEMPIFFNSQVFDIGKDNNSVDWFDAFASNTDENILSAEKKNLGRLYISKLINTELQNTGNTTKRLLRTIEATPMELEFTKILHSLSRSNADNESIVRYNWFDQLLHEDEIGAINRTSKKTNILCSEFIDYRLFGNILILDGTSNLTHTIYAKAGFKVIPLNNYHRYSERLFIEWGKLNTSKSKRADNRSEIKEQISSDILEKRQKGLNILPIPSKDDMNYYIKSGAITKEQHKEFFMNRFDDNDTLAINLHNVTGSNSMNKYNHIALLNLPIMQPDEYRLQAIAIYGADIDLRLVSDLENEERKEHKGKWFIDGRLQSLFEQQQKAELSQIIHRSSIRNINADDKVTIHLYHNKEQAIGLLMSVFGIDDENIKVNDIQKNNNFKVKCRKWAETILEFLKDNPNEEFTAYRIGNSKFKYWLKDNWNDNEQVITDIFKEYKIRITFKGKSNFRYFSYVNDEFENLFS